MLMESVRGSCSSANATTTNDDIGSDSVYGNSSHPSLNDSWPSKEELSRSFSVWRMEGELNYVTKA